MNDIFMIGMVVVVASAFVGVLAGKRLRRNRKEGI